MFANTFLLRACLVLVIFIVSISVFNVNAKGVELEERYIKRSVQALVKINLVNGSVMDIPEIYEIETIFKGVLAAQKQEFMPSPDHPEFTIEDSKNVINITFFNYLSDYYIIEKDYDLIAYYTDDLCDLYQQKYQKDCDEGYRYSIMQSLVSRIIKVKMNLNVNNQVSLSELNFVYEFDNSLNYLLKSLAQDVI